MTAQFAPKHMSGQYLMTSQVIDTAGNEHSLVLETYWMGDNRVGINTQGVGPIRYMFVISGRTNYRLYTSAQGARSAAIRVIDREMGN
jgi:hypothetical protein